MTGCRDTPITCRRKIAATLGLAPSKKKPWQFEGRCPHCRHGGFSITAGDQGPFPPRHIWCCNCHRCHCKAELVRTAMRDAGIADDCLGTFARSAPRATAGDGLRAAMEAVLTDRKIRALADLKIRMAEVLWGDAPADWAGFVAFAERAGVSRSKRYEAAARWGRRQRQ